MSGRSDPFRSTRGLKPGGDGNPQWTKGCASPNPGGRSSAAAELGRRIRERIPEGKLLIDYAEACLMGKESIEYNGVTIKIPTDEKSRAYCHSWLSERGWGRIKQELVIAEKSADSGRPDVRSMSLDRLRQIAAGEPDDGGDGVH